MEENNYNDELKFKDDEIDELIDKDDQYEDDIDYRRF